MRKYPDTCGTVEHPEVLVYSWGCLYMEHVTRCSWIEWVELMNVFGELHSVGKQWNEWIDIELLHWHPQTTTKVVYEGWFRTHDIQRLWSSDSFVQRVFVKLKWEVLGRHLWWQCKVEPSLAILEMGNSVSLVNDRLGALLSTMADSFVDEPPYKVIVVSYLPIVFMSQEAVSMWVLQLE